MINSNREALRHIHRPTNIGAVPFNLTKCTPEELELIKWAEDGDVVSAVKFLEGRSINGTDFNNPRMPDEVKLAVAKQLSQILKEQHPNEDWN